MATKTKKQQTVRQALDAMRKRFRGKGEEKVEALYLCKRELFYGVEKDGFTSGTLSESVYPVSLETAQAEAAHYKVELSEV